MSYDIELTEGAYADLVRLSAALAARWPDGVDRLTARFDKALTRLETFPLACGIAFENRDSEREVRHLLFELTKGRAYRALFTVQGNVVKILAIRAPGEKPMTPDELNG